MLFRSSNNKSLVGINAESDGNYSGSVGKKTTSTGIIITVTEERVLILTSQYAARRILTMNVTFNGGETVKGALVKYDSETGFGIIEVKYKNISKNTYMNIDPITIGNSQSLKNGSYCMLVGNPLGQVGSVLMGILTDNDDTYKTVDGEMQMFTLNTLIREGANGFMLNAKGELMGIITHDEDNSGEPNYARVIGVSDMTGFIEHLCNNSAIPYLGVNLSTIDDTKAKIYDIPQGAYVESVELSSPAMEAGIQAGDIILEINNQDAVTGRQVLADILSLPVKEDGPTDVTVKFLRYSKGEYVDHMVKLTIGNRKR